MKSSRKMSWGTHFRCGYAKHADFEIDVPFPERTRILVGFGREAQADMGGGLGGGRHQGCGEQVDEPLVGANGEGPIECGNVQDARLRTQGCQHVTGKLVNPVAQFRGAWRRHEPAPGAHEQRIAGGGAEPLEGSAHGGRTQAQAKGGFADAAFGKQRVPKQ